MGKDKGTDIKNFLGTKVTLYKVFDGKRYNLVAYGPSKKKATEWAKIARLVGRSCRIVELYDKNGIWDLFGSSTHKRMYAVYER